MYLRCKSCLLVNQYPLSVVCSGYYRPDAAAADGYGKMRDKYFAVSLLLQEMANTAIRMLEGYPMLDAVPNLV